MKRKAFLIPVVFGVAFALLIGCNTPNKAARGSASNDGVSFDLKSRTVTLNNGIKMPILGIGVFTLTPAQAEESVYHALLDGYRLIDTANAYMNERAVGRGITRSGVPREEIFITTKLWVSVYSEPEKAIDETLARLGVDYIDLLLLHQPYGDIITAYQGMEKAVSAGKVRSIGLSNFYEPKFDEIMRIAAITPAVLQNEANPFFHETRMKEYLKKYGTVLMAWYPLGGRGNTQTLFNHQTIVEIAKAHNKTSAQVVLRWHIQAGNIAIPGSSNPDHIQENIEIFDFALTDEEMQKIALMDEGHGKYPEFDEATGQRFLSFSPDFNAQE
jgi:diketogulonate reductase-like aldo/keto reductase